MLRGRNKELNNKINHEDLAESGQPNLAAGQSSTALLARQALEKIKVARESEESGHWGMVASFEGGAWVLNPALSLYSFGNLTTVAAQRMGFLF